MRVILALYLSLIFSNSFCQEPEKNEAFSKKSQTTNPTKKPHKKPDKLDAALNDVKAYYAHFSKLFEGKEKDVGAIIKTLKEQMNWGQTQEQMFSGKNKNLKGEKPLMANGMEELMNVSLSPFRIMNPRELEQVVLENTAGGPLHAHLAKNYKSLSYVVKVMQDPKALPFLGRMVDQKNKFYLFLGFMLISFIALYTYKKQKFGNQSYFSTLIPRLILFVISGVVRFIVLIAIFYKELKPIFEVTFSHFT